MNLGELGPYAFACFVFALGLTMVGSHLLARRRHAREDVPSFERDYRRRQFRRRVQASSMLAILGAGMAWGCAIPKEKYPSLYVYTWLGLFLLLIWIVGLALGDAWSTRVFYRRMLFHRSSATARKEAPLSKAPPDERDSRA